MKITRIEPIVYDAGAQRVWCVVRITTDEGVTGYGEASTTEPFLAASVVRSLAQWLVGEDASRIQDLWQRMYRRHHNVRGGNLWLAAMSGIEHALWDIKGKAAGLPVFEMLGGAIRARVLVYVNHMFFPSAAGEDAPAHYAARAAEAVERGYRAVKIAPFGTVRDTISPGELRHVCAVVRAVRETVGPDVEIGIDTHSRFGVGAAITVGRALEEFTPYFLEELVPPENVAAMRKVREAISAPMATGERVYTKWGFRELLEAQAVEIIQMDTGHCGGILEARLIAAMAETYYVTVAPHAAYGPIALAAALQLDACIPNFLIQEMPVRHEAPSPPRELLNPPLTMEGGTTAIPTGPGLGVTVDEEVLERHRIDG